MLYVPLTLVCSWRADVRIVQLQSGVFPWTSQEQSYPCLCRITSFIIIHIHSPHIHIHTNNTIPNESDRIQAQCEVAPKVRLCWKYLELTTHATGSPSPTQLHTQPHTHAYTHMFNCVWLDYADGESHPLQGWRSRGRSYKYPAICALMLPFVKYTRCKMPVLSCQLFGIPKYGYKTNKSAAKMREWMRKGFKRNCAHPTFYLCIPCCFHRCFICMCNSL